MIGLRRSSLISILAFGGLVAAVSSAQEPTQFQVLIHKGSSSFDPPTLAVEVGDTVTWVNNDEKQHLTASIPGTGPTDKLEIYCPKFYPNTVCTNTFDTPGKYPYFCFIHKNMLGEVIVLEK